MTISPEYIRLMRQVQDVMQEHIERRGIVVECNPTSNVLIGTFETYEKHPIFRFYDSGLGVAADRQLCRQMEVCVNTDDLGIFDTSLEFEYALLFRTLDAQLDADGKKRYQTCDILRYLKNLQDLGMRAVFPCCDPGTPVEMRRERSYGGFYQGPDSEKAPAAIVNDSIRLPTNSAQYLLTACPVFPRPKISTRPRLIGAYFFDVSRATSIMLTRHRQRKIDAESYSSKRSRNNPKTHYYLYFTPALLFKMMMERSHKKDSLFCSFVIEHLNHYRQSLNNEQASNNKGANFSFCHNCNTTKRSA